MQHQVAFVAECDLRSEPQSTTNSALFELRADRLQVQAVVTVCATGCQCNDNGDSDGTKFADDASASAAAAATTSSALQQLAAAHELLAQQLATAQAAAATAAAQRDALAGELAASRETAAAAAQDAREARQAAEEARALAEGLAAQNQVFDMREGCARIHNSRTSTQDRLAAQRCKFFTS
jgi:hypothetical protein